jgi:hypothetical protein
VRLDGRPRPDAARRRTGGECSTGRRSSHRRVSLE